jgi:hypothetical protein
MSEKPREQIILINMQSRTGAVSESTSRVFILVKISKNMLCSHVMHVAGSTILEMRCLIGRRSDCTLDDQDGRTRRRVF